MKNDVIKYDRDKPNWSLLPMEAVGEVVKVMTMGAEKYSKDSWKKMDDFDRYASAMLRHIAAHQSGEKFDSESGLLHISHAACNAIFLIWKELQNAKETCDHKV